MRIRLLPDRVVVNRSVNAVTLLANMVIHQSS